MHRRVVARAVEQNSSKLPAHASRFVRKDVRLKRFLIVAGTDVSSNCDVGDGPAWGSWKTVPFATHGEISIDVVRSPSRRKSKTWPHAGWRPGTMHGDSSAGTPSYGGTTWS